MKSILVKIFLLLVCLGLGLGGGLGYARYQLNQAQQQHARETDKLNRKLQQWENKYKERNAQIDLGVRTSRGLREEIVTLKDEMASLQLSVGGSLKKKEARIAGLNADVAALELQRLRLQAKEERLTTALDDRKHRVAELEKMAAGLEQKANTLEQNLSKKSHDFERCFKHNGEMAKAAGELLERYQNKKLITSLSEQEPLIGIGKVELEHLVQEYGFKIEDHRLEK